MNYTVIVGLAVAVLHSAPHSPVPTSKFQLFRKDRHFSDYLKITLNLMSFHTFENVNLTETCDPFFATFGANYA